MNYHSNIYNELQNRIDERERETDERVWNAIMVIVVALPVLYLLAAYFY